MEAILSRITANPHICHCKPTICNTRYLVQSLLDYLAAGDTAESLMEKFADLEAVDVQACIK